MDTAEAYVWRLQNFVLGEHILTPSEESRTPVKVKNFCLVRTILVPSYTRPMNNTPKRGEAVTDGLEHGLPVCHAILVTACHIEVLL